MLQCEICGVEKESKFKLDGHTRMVHGEYPCKQCGELIDGGMSAMSLHIRREHKKDKTTAEPAEPVEVDQAEGVAERAPVFDPGEVARDDRRSGWRAKLWGADKATKGPKADSTRERRPVRRTRRSPTTDIFAMGWAGIGSLLIRGQIDVPVGRTMQFQGPVAGAVLDRLVAGTWVDRMLQPVASRTREIEDAAALFALPALVATIERSPELAIALEPLVRQALRVNLIAMAPVVKRQRQAEKEYAAAVAEMGIAADGDADPVEAMLAAIFAPVDGQAPPPPPSANGSGAWVPDGAAVG